MSLQKGTNEIKRILGDIYYIMVKEIEIVSYADIEMPPRYMKGKARYKEHTIYYIYYHLVLNFFPGKIHMNLFTVVISWGYGNMSYTLSILLICH